MVLDSIDNGFKEKCTILLLRKVDAERWIKAVERERETERERKRERERERERERGEGAHIEFVYLVS